MTTFDPAESLAHALEHIARDKGTPAAVQMAEAMVVAAVAVLIRERGPRYAYRQLTDLSDGVALRIIERAQGCGNDD